MTETVPAPSTVLALLRRHGWNATSFQVLEPGFRHWSPDRDASVGYVDTGGAWVVAGAPLCPPDRLAEVSAAFVRHARASRRRAVFFAVEERFVEATRWPALLVGEQPEWDADAWDAVLAGSSSLREQLRRSRAKGVRVRLAGADELSPGHPVRQRLEALVRAWLRGREMPPMGFLVAVDPLTLLADQRVFLAEWDGDVVAFLWASPIYARPGWLLEHLVRGPGAPNGTAELLVDAAMRASASDEREAMVTLGLAPLAGEVAPALRWARSAGSVLFDFEGLRAFKARLRPARWSPIYLVHPRGASSWRAVLDVLTAFAGGHLLRFGVATLLRGPSVAVRVLAGALVPWTVALAVAPRRWFPTAGVQWAWVAWDVVLAAGLFRLAARWSDLLSRVLTATVVADAALTTVQAAAWNLPRARRPLDVVVTAVAVAAPVLASVVLWRARVRRRDPIGAAGRGLRPVRSG